MQNAVVLPNIFPMTGAQGAIGFQMFAPNRDRNLRCKSANLRQVRMQKSKFYANMYSGREAQRAISVEIFRASVGAARNF